MKHKVLSRQKIKSIKSKKHAAKRQSGIRPSVSNQELAERSISIQTADIPGDKSSDKENADKPKKSKAPKQPWTLPVSKAFYEKLRIRGERILKELGYCAAWMKCLMPHLDAYMLKGEKLGHHYEYECMRIVFTCLCFDIDLAMQRSAQAKARAAKRRELSSVETTGQEPDSNLEIDKSAAIHGIGQYGDSTEFENPDNLSVNTASGVSVKTQSLQQPNKSMENLLQDTLLPTARTKTESKPNTGDTAAATPDTRRLHTSLAIADISGPNNINLSTVTEKRQKKR